MKPYGSLNKKAKKWCFWGDKIPTKFRRYYNKATRKILNKIDMKKLLILLAMIGLLASCKDSKTITSELQQQFKTKNVYSINDINYIIYTDSSIVHIQTFADGPIKSVVIIK